MADGLRGRSLVAGGRGAVAHIRSRRAARWSRRAGLLLAALFPVLVAGFSRAE